MFLAPVDESGLIDTNGDTSPGGNWDYGGDGRDCGDCVGRNWCDQPGGGREDRTGFDGGAIAGAPERRVAAVHVSGGAAHGGAAKRGIGRRAGIAAARRRADGGWRGLGWGNGGPAVIGFLRRWVLHNFWLKVLSLLIATGLWLAISPDQEPAEVAIRVPIEFQHVPAHLEISSATIPDAQIRVRGPEHLIRQLRSTDIHAELELGDAKPGERTFDLTSQQIRHQRGLTVVQVVPGQVHLSFDTRLTREVEIHPRVTGNFPAGEQIGKVLVDPEKIKITGPQHHVELVDAATTDPVDASGTRTMAIFVTNVYVADALVQVVQPTPVRVTVIMEKSTPAGSER